MVDRAGSGLPLETRTHTIVQGRGLPVPPAPAVGGNVGGRETDEHPAGA